MVFSLPEILVSSMESVQHSHHPVHLVEPAVE